jgi:hypothetical protein
MRTFKDPQLNWVFTLINELLIMGSSSGVLTFIDFKKGKRRDACFYYSEIKEIGKVD